MKDWCNANCMLIWNWSDAPPELRALSQHGGDENFVAYVPQRGNFDLLADEWFGTMQENASGDYTCWDEHNGTAFGPCSVERISLDDGAIMYVGSHA